MSKFPTKLPEIKICTVYKQFPSRILSFFQKMDSHFIVFKLIKKLILFLFLFGKTQSVVGNTTKTLKYIGPFISILHEMVKIIQPMKNVSFSSFSLF